MVVLFLIMALGYLAGKANIMTIQGNKVLSVLINCITNPCNILYSAICTEHVLSNREVLGIVGIALAVYAALILLAQVVPSLLRVPKEQNGQYKFMVIFSNIGYMGIPVISAIYGPSAVFEIAIFIMIFNILAYTYGVYLICGGHRDSGFRAKDLLTPMTVTALSSLALYFLNVQAPAVIADTLNTVRSITTPGAMLIIGCALSAVPIRDVFSNWRLYIIAALKLLVIPLAGYFVLRPLISNQLVLGVVVAVLGMPIATNFTMLSAQYDKDQKLAASAVFITTLLSVVSIPLLMGLLFAG